MKSITPLINQRRDRLSHIELRHFLAYIHVLLSFGSLGKCSLTREIGTNELIVHIRVHTVDKNTTRKRGRNKKIDAETSKPLVCAIQQFAGLPNLVRLSQNDLVCIQMCTIRGSWLFVFMLDKIYHILPSQFPTCHAMFCIIGLLFYQQLTSRMPKGIVSRDQGKQKKMSVSFSISEFLLIQIVIHCTTRRLPKIANDGWRCSNKKLPKKYNYFQYKKLNFRIKQKYFAQFLKRIIKIQLGTRFYLSCFYRSICKSVLDNKLMKCFK